MTLSLIFAMDESNAIGFNNQLPWHLPADLKKFKEITMGHHIIMGRNTHESIGRVLPGRTNIVITRQPDYKAAEGAVVMHSLADALEYARNKGENEAFVIGGAELGREALGLADRFYLTRIHHTFGADTYFPVLEPTEWKVSSEERFEPDEKNKYAFTFQVLDRDFSHQ